MIDPQLVPNGRCAVDLCGADLDNAAAEDDAGRIMTKDELAALKGRIAELQSIYAHALRAYNRDRKSRAKTEAIRAEFVALGII